MLSRTCKSSKLENNSLKLLRQLIKYADAELAESEVASKIENAISLVKQMQILFNKLKEHEDLKIP